MPGKVAEFDWGQVKLIIAGKLTVFEMSAFTAAKSNYRFADIYYSQKTESFFKCPCKFLFKMLVEYTTKLSMITQRLR